MVKPGDVLTNPGAAEVLLTRTAAAQDELLGLSLPSGQPVPLKLRSLAGVVALAALQADAGFRKTWGKGVGPGRVYAACRDTVQYLASKLPSLQTLAQFASHFCYSLKPDGGRKLVCHLAEAVLSIAGQFVAVPLRRDFSKATLTWS